MSSSRDPPSKSAERLERWVGVLRLQFAPRLTITCLIAVSDVVKQPVLEPVSVEGMRSMSSAESSNTLVADVIDRTWCLLLDSVNVNHTDHFLSYISHIEQNNL